MKTPLDFVAEVMGSGRLRLGPAVLQAQPTRVLRERRRLAAKSRGDLQSAVESAGYYARKQHRTMYVYAGNSYGHRLWRVSADASEYLDPVNNTGDQVVSVTPELEVSRHDVER